MMEINEKEIRKTIQNRLIECRKEKGLTQTEVGELVDKKKTTVASWEGGKSLPDADTLYRLATYYKKTISYMYGESDK